MADEIKKIKRSEFATFMNTTPSGVSPNWARMGKGITSQKITYNPVTTSETYIDEDNATNSVESYAPTLDGTQTCYKGEPIFTFLDGLRQGRKTGADLETDIVLVNIYDKQTDNSYSAEKNHVVIQLGDFGGDGGGTVQMTYTIALSGDPVQGKATITDGALTFTDGTEITE